MRFAAPIGPSPCKGCGPWGCSTKYRREIAQRLFYRSGPVENALAVGTATRNPQLKQKVTTHPLMIVFHLSEHKVLKNLVVEAGIGKHFLTADENIKVEEW